MIAKLINTIDIHKGFSLFLFTCYNQNFTVSAFHLAVWRNFIWLFGAISFGCLAQFRLVISTFH